MHSFLPEELRRIRAELLPSIGASDAATRTRSAALVIDAGIAHLRLVARSQERGTAFDITFASNADLRSLLRAEEIDSRWLDGHLPIVASGKLAENVCQVLGNGKVVHPAAAAWLAARDLIARECERVRSLARIEISASGYLLVGVERDGRLRENFLLANPRCGAGSGINLDRVLQKLGLKRSDVDGLLARFAGDTGRQAREAIAARTDRCGVFSSSATISDKNQGIPLDVALAATLKSEVLKACRRLPPGFDKVWLAGRVFHWQFARDCASDFLAERGVSEVACDPDNDELLNTLHGSLSRVGIERIAQPDRRLLPVAKSAAYPSFGELKRRYESSSHYVRLAAAQPLPIGAELAQRVLDIGLDVGSTMAKAVLADAGSGEILVVDTRSNAGDTVETLKQLFGAFRRPNVETLQVRRIGVTGSARYQVAKVLEHIYPELAGRVSTLVENYAHARGSIDIVRDHIDHLKRAGISDVNQETCIVVDIGGEDTKISTVALSEGELFGNAMNLKCSAGTGSLMDTIAAMFGMTGVLEAYGEALDAPRALAINATCAVFLMENARKLQVQGEQRDVILASACWGIVENMARSLWTQLALPRNAVVLLHGQTMCSEPLPLAVAHRMQSFLNADCYALVPPIPGHRACIGLIRTLGKAPSLPGVPVRLSRLRDAQVSKRIVVCRGAACDDAGAQCNRAALTCRVAGNAKTLAFTVGGCSAVNEMLSRRKEDNRSSDCAAPVHDTYQAIWDFFDAALPRNDRRDRLVIPRSFAVSEWAFLFAHMFATLGLPVHVDNVRESDLSEAQPLFNVDSCAPLMGAVGQFRRLAGEPHGVILGIQIEGLSTQGRSQGSTCTVNQGGIAVACNLARRACPGARLELISVDLRELDAGTLGEQLHGRLAPVFKHFAMEVEPSRLLAAIAEAIRAHYDLRQRAADLAARLANEALDAGLPVALVVGREYVLNPGIFDSHLRRLLRDRRMAVLPSYVLSLDLDPSHGTIYWRNPHFIVSLLDAVARRSVSKHLQHSGLRDVFRRIEHGSALMPVIQISTFGCGPDSIIAPLIAEIMKCRPFLLIQSDAVIKELAHLENRINTYVRQLERGLTGPQPLGDEGRFEVLTLSELRLAGPLDRSTDAIYFPTFSDNRTVTALLRGAGYCCIDTYVDGADLPGLIREGRKATGDAVCAPLAGTYADLMRAIEDFTRRRRASDPQVAGKRRLIYFEIKGSGPCRQGQYPEVHQLLFHRQNNLSGTAARTERCGALPCGGVVRFLAAQEADGFNIGVEPWLLARAHQAIVLQGVLHQLLFTGVSCCRDFAEYQSFLLAHQALKAEILNILEAPTPIARFSGLLDRGGGLPAPLKALLRGLACRIAGRALERPLRRFARRWRIKTAAAPAVRIVLAGEIYMRVTQAEEIVRLLLAHLGFGRFTVEYTPAWSYLEYLLDEDNELAANAGNCHAAGPGDVSQPAVRARKTGARRRRNEAVRFLLRQVLAAPLYRAAGLAMPAPTDDILATARELLPTLRPVGEILTYVGETLRELRHGADIVLNVAPNGCMVSSMGELLTPCILDSAGGEGRIQNLFSADGDVDEELLTMALLKVMGPERYYAMPPNEAYGTSTGATTHCTSA